MYTKMKEQSFIVRRSYLATRSSRVLNKFVHICAYLKTRLDETLNLYVYMCVDVLSNRRFFFLLKILLSLCALMDSNCYKKIHSIFIFFMCSASNMFILQCQ